MKSEATTATLDTEFLEATDREGVMAMMEDAMRGDQSARQPGEVGNADPPSADIRAYYRPTTLCAQRPPQPALMPHPPWYASSTSFLAVG